MRTSPGWSVGESVGESVPDGNQTIAPGDHTIVRISVPDSSARSRPDGGRARRLVLGVVTTAALVTAGVACGADGEDATSNLQLSEQAQRGVQIMNTNGCAACHGTDWNGGTGPPLVGLYETERTLLDGTVVIADDEYLRLAIAEPAEQMLEGWSLRMPANGLDDAQIEDVIQFIRETGPAATGSDATDSTGAGDG